MTAFLIWIKPDSIAVICPLCSKPEVQPYQLRDSQIDRSGPVVVKSLCSQSRATYRVVFPEEVNLGFEKNWAAGRLDVVGLDLSELEIVGAWDPTRFEVPEPSMEEKPIDENYNRRSAIRVINRMDLGDMTEMSVVRVKPNSIVINAPMATMGGVPLSEPLGVLNADRPLYEKTTAVLNRGGPFNPIIAVSGWLDSFRSPKNILKQKLWTNEVFKLSEYVGHKLKSNSRDRKKPGQVKAAHAEKQLIAFVARIHRYWEDGFEPNYMYELRSLSPPIEEVWIGIDNVPCDDCISFRDKVEAVLKIKIHFVKMKRETSFGQFSYDQNIQGPRTPIKMKRVGFSLSTPPDSGSQLSEDDSAYFEDDEDDQEDEIIETSDDQSGWNGRNLRFLGTPQRPITIQPSPPSSPTLRTFRRDIRNRHTEALPLEPRRSTSPALPQHSAYSRNSNAFVVTTSAEVENSTAMQRDETDEEVEKILREKIIVDLTLDNTMDDDSEGSVFYPEDD